MTASATSTRPRPRPLLVASLAGDQAAMGAQHGALLREAGGYEAAIEFYRDLPGRILRGGDRSALTGALLGVAQPMFDAALRRLERHRPTAYRRRSERFLEALGRPARDARFFLVVDLVQNVIGLAARLRLGPFARRAGRALPGACSSLAVWGEASSDGRLLHARNFDLPGIGVWDQHPEVVFCAPDEGLRYGFVTTRGADLPGITAFNEAGIAVTAHTRFHRDVATTGAAIIDLGHAIVQRARTLDDAARIARARRSASTWGLLVSSAAERRAATLELTAAGVEIVEPEPGAAFLACTNRYRRPALRAREVSPSPAWERHSDGREAVMERTVRAAAGMDVAALQALLGSHEAPDVPGMLRAAGGVLAQPLTVQSVVFDPDRQSVHVAVGGCPTSAGPWIEVPFRWDRPGTWQITPPPAHDAAGPYDRGRRGAAYALWVEAVRLAEEEAPLPEVEQAVEEAVVLDPDEPSYRLAAGGHALRRGDLAAARAHFEAGLRRERSELRRGQLWLWGARAADAAGDREAARAWRRALLETREPLLAQARAAAVSDARRRRPRRDHRRMTVDLVLMALHG